MQDLATFLPGHMASSARNGFEPSILAAQHQEPKGRDSGTLTCRRAPKRSEADWIKCAEICTPLALTQHPSARNHANHLKNNSNEGTKTSLQIWPPVAGTGDRQAERRHPYDAIQIWRLNPASFPFSIPGLRLFFLSPDFSPALCLNSLYRGFPKGDSCETHRIGFRRSILFVRTIRRPAGFGAGIVDQSFNAARIEAPSEATPLQKTQRQTPAHVT